MKKTLDDNLSIKLGETVERDVLIEMKMCVYWPYSFNMILEPLTHSLTVQFVPTVGVPNLWYAYHWLYIEAFLVVQGMMCKK